jgi:MoaA/NifB/PqqE/SkfB family radical SAM enzyme
MKFPYIFNVSLTSTCFLKCNFCLKGTDTETYQKYTPLSVDNFKHIINEVTKNGTRIIEMTPTVGDILSYNQEDLLELFDYLDSKDDIEHYYFYTSAVSSHELPDSFMQSLAPRKKLCVYISLYGSSVQEFKRITRGSDKQYRILKNNIIKFKKYITNLTVLLRSSEKHDTFFRVILEEMRTYDDWVNHSHSHTSTGWSDIDKPCQYAIMDNGTAPNGDILVCTWIDGKSETKIGNIYDDDIGDIYNNIGNNLRQSLCYNCDFYSNIGNFNETYDSVITNFYNDFSLPHEQ